MEISGILEALKERAQWTEARKIIVRAGLKAGKGWPRTISRYAGADVMQESADALASGLAEHVLVGDKALRLYQIPDENLAELRSFASEIEVPESPFSLAFPCKAVDGARLGNDESVLCEKYNDDDGIFLVYSSIRKFEIKERLDLAALGELPAALAGFSAVYGSKIIERQLFDILWIPLAGNIVFSIADSPKGVPPEFISAAHAKIRKTLMDGIGYYPEPINLFGAIQAAYDSQWGTVVELGFLTDTGSVKHEHMKLTCLREEPFHVGGKGAVDGIIHPFSILIRWLEKDGDMEWEPEFTLHSSVYEAHSINPSLHDAYFGSGIIVRDLKRLRRRLSHILESNPA
ncbi:hypothetical protein [Stenotrophomonas maltophilia]|uniref:Uncharacterized protein n=1 Tax=Stenotrophomonas maltophilia (strain R551-3) TaxID=391008 RepID=B4SNF8_STRM5|nr:hypothetical protein [Stenotrophomonas maltophilia]ACF52183.1 conserved hypothetical protein [Stenotrophomonas maltophilia R551-3]